METNHLKFFTAFLISATFAISTFSQDTTIQSGFYVNYGHTKVESINCFNFDNLIFTFEVTEEMLEFDQLVFSFYILNNENRGWSIYTKEVDGRVFRAQIKDKKNFSVLVSGENLSSKSREDLAFTDDDKWLNNMVLEASIRAGIKTGTEEKWNQYTEKYITKDTYTYITLTVPTNQVKLENRKKTMDPTHPFAKKKDRIIDPSPNCFSYDGSKNFEVYFLQ